LFQTFEDAKLDLLPDFSIPIYFQYFKILIIELYIFFSPFLALFVVVLLLFKAFFDFRIILSSSLSRPSKSFKSSSSISKSNSSNSFSFLLVEVEVKVVVEVVVGLEVNGMRPELKEEDIFIFGVLLCVTVLRYDVCLCVAL
jgi:hypothetical protein